MKLVYALTAIEAGRIIFRSKTFKKLKSKIGFNPEYNTKTAVEDLSARVWELEQMIHELCKIERQKNENSIQNK